MVSSVDRKKARSRKVKTGGSRMAKTTLAKANLALKLVRSLNRDIENKSHSFTISQEGDTTATTLNLTSIAEGAGNTTRVGNELNLKDFEMRGKFSWNLNDISGKAQIMRIIMYIDKQQEADTIPTALTLMGSATVQSVTIPNRLTVPSRFTIIKDKTWVLHQPIQSSEGDVGNGQGVGTAFFHWKFPLKKKLKFNGINGSDIQKNGVYLQLSSDTTVGPTLIANGRFNFTG